MFQWPLLAGPPVHLATTRETTMKRLLTHLTAICLALALFSSAGWTADAPKAAAGEVNTVCPISGKPVDPKITVVYEGRTYAFADEACRTKFNAAREASLYHRLGGQAAINAVVDAFYVKVLADARIKQHFADVDMEKQAKRQKAFLSAAFGSPVAWAGKDMRKAHMGLNLTEADFNAVAENLLKTMEECKVPKPLIDEVMAIAGSVKNDVLNKPKDAK